MKLAELEVVEARLPAGGRCSGEQLRARRALAGPWTPIVHGKRSKEKGVETAWHCGSKADEKALGLQSVDLIKRENPSIVDGSMAEDWRKEYIVGRRGDRLKITVDEWHSNLILPKMRSRLNE